MNPLILFFGAILGLSYFTKKDSYIGNNDYPKKFHGYKPWLWEKRMESKT